MSQPSLTENLLLAALPSDVLGRIAARATITRVEESDRLFNMEEENDVFFPLGSVISLLHHFADGTEIEVAMLGSEGMAGSNVWLGVPQSPHTGLIQGAGHVARIPASEFRTGIEAEPAAKDVLRRYSHVLFMHASQLAACNRLHVVPERLAHWLLLLHDRVDGDEMIVTQEFLARMLATRRAGINVAVRELTEAGAIEHRRNRIIVSDRRRLEEESCVCYEMMVAEYEKALGFPPKRSRR
ncbi:MAG TPA: Crp/Fnr family transcriptional regulator [Thermoanaerobaculia bacterium]|nr:Crp/Fnr family transcriptional regulator [Thermoanaerobaculia bacterium]